MLREESSRECARTNQIARAVECFDAEQRGFLLQRTARVFTLVAAQRGERWFRAVGREQLSNRIEAGDLICKRAGCSGVSRGRRLRSYARRRDRCGLRRLIRR
jgi:hypothetical protein